MIEKKNNTLIIVLVCLVVALLGICGYLLFKDGKVEDNKQTQKQTVNVLELKENLEKINNELFELLHKETTTIEFEQNGQKYLTKEMIEKLKKYYNTETKTICLDVGGCNIDGGYLGNTTDNMRVFFQIDEITYEVIKATGFSGEPYFGEDENANYVNLDNLSKQSIIYKLEDNTWKIDNFDIKDNN